MALGALIGAYQEDEAGGLRALLPLAGQTLIEYQARCLAALGAAPLLVLVERVPVALNDAFERLRGEGIAVVAVSDGGRGREPLRGGHRRHPARRRHRPRHERRRAARRGSDGEAAILTVPDDDEHDGFERIDASHRWAGLARLPAALVGATAAMIGDWDLQSTLLRRAVQSGARLVPAASGEGAGPFLADGEAMAGFERRLLLASRGARSDWVSRFILPLVEEVATERLMETRLRPEWLVRAALALTLGAALRLHARLAVAGAGRAASLATPLDLVARRIALLRLRPLSPSLAVAAPAVARGRARACSRWAGSRRATAAGGARWSPRWPPPPSPRRCGSSAAPPSRPARSISSRAAPRSGWRSRSRSAAGGTSISALVALYAAASFFIAQHFHHRVARD